MLVPLLTMACMTPSAQACAALVTTDGGAVATSQAQQVILELTSTGTAVEYANTYTGVADDFGWIIVVPAPFESMIDGDLSRFERLAERSQPRIQVTSSDGDESEGCGCAGAAQSKSAVDTRPGSFGDTGLNDVSVVAEGFTGTYDYTVVESDDSDGLVSWLDANDWVLGANEAALVEYVDEGGFAFVLVELSTEAPLASGESGMLPPVRVESGNSELMFPARMARDAAPENQSTRIFVLGDETAEMTGAWSSVTFDWIDAGSGNPDAAFETALWEATGDRAAYAQVFSGQTQDGWLTRFETRAPRDVHTADVTIALSGGRSSSETVVQSSARSVATVSGAFGAGLVALFLPLLSMIRARRV